MMRLEPELTWLNGRFHGDVGVVVDPSTGRIVEVSGPGRGPGEEDGGRRVPLPGRALLPGFVNAHSHAFQRLIRGRTQSRPAGVPAADFWSWREAMYAAALSLSADDLYRVSRFCFLEMMRTGITAVGEFHYLHNRRDGTPYDDPNRLALAVIAAAKAVGLRIVLLDVCYATGGIGRGLESRQRRFRAASLDGFLERSGRLHDRLAGGAAEEPVADLATAGIAPHSIRAVPRDWLRPLRDWAAERDVPVHMHAAERPAEVEAALAAYGRRPVELLAEEGLLDDRFTVIHGIHLSDAEVRLLGASGATVCACPTTERGLGDGFVRGRDLLDAGARLALGTDSHTNLDFLEEMRLIEHHERLQRLERVVITDEPGPDDHHHVAPELLDMATLAGARSLGLEAGEIAPGRLADIVAIDLDHHALAGWSRDTLAAMLTLSATPDVVADVWVGGARRLVNRHHTDEAEVTAAFREVAGR